MYNGIVAYAEDDSTVLYLMRDIYFHQVPDISINIKSSPLSFTWPQNLTLDNCIKYVRGEGGIFLKETFIDRPEYALWQAQVIFSVRVLGVINWYRRAGHKNTIGQQEVYAYKREQAEAVLADPTIDPAKVELIYSYSAHNQIPIEAAAKIILLAAEEQKQRLIKTELIREDFIFKVRRCRTPEEVDALYQEFNTKYFIPFKLTR